jgi:glycosyltransferase involved in cell wall biosynthesis
MKSTNYKKLVRILQERGIGYVLRRSFTKLQQKITQQILIQALASPEKLTKALPTQFYKLLRHLYPEIPVSSDLNSYLWLLKNIPRQADLQRMQESLIFLSQPKISILMPVYNTPPALLKSTIDSVIHQIYSNWELCIADDASTEAHVKQILVSYAAQDSRIKVIYRQENGHISHCSNSALKLATGEFVALLDHDDLLAPDALYEIALLINRHPEADMIYSDEAKLDANEFVEELRFKPDWCPNSFLSRMYICHLGVYRRSLLIDIGGFRAGFEGSQDYDLVLRFTEKTDKIFHIPKILYYWRIHAGSAASGADAKPYAFEAARLAISEAIQRRGEPGQVIESGRYPGHYTIRYEISQSQKVSIFLSACKSGKQLDQCLTSIFTRSSYPNYEVVLIDSKNSASVEVLEKWAAKETNRLKYVSVDDLSNFSKVNNNAVCKTDAELLLFLSPAVEVITPDWLEGLIEQAQRPSIGAVGELLLYPNQKIYHAGITLGVTGIAGYSHQNFHALDPGYENQIVSTNDYLAVTADCLMCRRLVFEQVHGFEESLQTSFQDIDFCLKVFEQGYRNLYLPHVKLYRHVIPSKNLLNTPKRHRELDPDTAYMHQKWQHFMEHDPCYSPHLTRDSADYGIRLA